MSTIASITEPARTTPVPFDVDVCVVGGGPAGICAAVAAARNGASTLLVERYGFLGGMATAGLVNPFMNFHVAGEPIIAGIFAEWIDGMRRRGGYLDHGKMGRNIFEPEAAKAAAMELCRDAGVQLLLHSFLDRTITEGAKITHAICAGKTRLAVAARQFVDCTGDGDLAALAGAQFEFGRPADHAAQPMTLCFRMKGVDWSHVPNNQQLREQRDQGRAVIQKLYDTARNEGRIDCPRHNVLYFSCIHDDEIHFNTTRVIGRNATDSLDLTAAEMEARRQVEQFVSWLRDKVPGFEHAYLATTAAQIGIRESRRIKGLYELTEDDVLSCRSFADAVARAHYDIDIHNPTGGGTVIKHLPPDKWYEIPYGCLVPVGMDNLLAAGRCISADHVAHSSLRVMPIAAALGQAAGTAAAMAVRDNLKPTQIQAPKLVETLMQQGQSLAPQTATFDNTSTTS